MAIPTAPNAYKVLGTYLYCTIAATLTKIPGLTNLKLSLGEKESMSRQSLEIPYATPTPSGTFSEQSFTADLIWDPLDAVHQFLHVSWNPDELDADDKTIIVGKIVFGTTGVEMACTYFLTKFDIDLEKGAGMKVSIEGKFVYHLPLNEADPV